LTQASPADCLNTAEASRGPHDIFKVVNYLPAHKGGLALCSRAPGRHQCLGSSPHRHLSSPATPATVLPAQLMDTSPGHTASVPSVFPHFLLIHSTFPHCLCPGSGPAHCSPSPVPRQPASLLPVTFLSPHLIFHAPDHKIPLLNVASKAFHTGPHIWSQPLPVTLTCASHMPLNPCNNPGGRN
jgi:hypothetical protein